MSIQRFSWPRALLGALIVPVVGLSLLAEGANISGALVPRDSDLFTSGVWLLILAVPIVLILSVVIGGYVFGRGERAEFGALLGAVLALAASYVLAIPASRLLGDILEIWGVLILLGYFTPVAVILGARTGYHLMGRSAARR